MTLRASASIFWTASYWSVPYAITPGSSGISAIHRPSSSISTSTFIEASLADLKTLSIRRVENVVECFRLLDWGKVNACGAGLDSRDGLKSLIDCRRDQGFVGWQSREISFRREGGEYRIGIGLSERLSGARKRRAGLSNLENWLFLNLVMPKSRAVLVDSCLSSLAMGSVENPMLGHLFAFDLGECLSLLGRGDPASAG